MEEQIPRGTTFVPPLVTVHFDGACEPAKGGGVATYGFVVSGEGLDHEEKGLAVRPWSPRATNNVAEYTAAIRALEYLRSKGFRGHVVVIGDSELIVRQSTGEYEVRAEHLKAYHDRLLALAREFEEVRFEWVPRARNLRADELSKEALEDATPDAARTRPATPVEVVPEDEPPGTEPPDRPADRS